MIKLKHLLYEKLYIRDHDEVVEIQTILDKLGYDLGPAGIDGIYGRYTKNAVRDYQRDNGTIRVDGLVGPETWPELQKEKEKLNIPQDEIEKNKEEVPDQSNTHTQPDDDEVDVTEFDISQPVTYTGPFPEKNVRLVEKAMDQFGITNPYVRIAMLSAIAKESGFKPIEEIGYENTRDNNYIRRKLPQLKHMSDKELDDLKAQGSKAFFDKAYASRGGYRYRGRGFIQLTGIRNYKAYSPLIGVDIFNNPDKALEPATAAKTAAMFLIRILKSSRLKARYGDSNYKDQDTANKAIANGLGGPGNDPTKSPALQDAIENTADMNKYFSYPGLEQDDQIT